MTEVWTLVAHSGLPNAVEETRVRTAAERARVERVGGVLYATYDEASEAALTANYPPHVHGFIPQVAGRFSAALVGGLRIYLPPTR